MNLTLRQLEVFLAVARTLSFSEAARQIGLSQPALSTAIRKLENALDARLFDRDTRNVALTPAGVELLGLARRLQSEFDAAFSDMREFLAGRRGRLVIAASPSLAAGFLPPVLEDFERLHPGVALQVHDALAETSLGLVRSGTAELALAAGTFDDPELDYQELFRDRLVLLCRRDHPLARETVVAWQALQPHRLITLDRTSSVQRLVEAACAQHGIVLRHAFELSQTTTVIGFLAQGLGVAILPHSLLPLTSGHGIVHRRLHAPEIDRRICIVTQRGRSLSPLAGAFVQACTARARGVGPGARRGR